MHAPQYLFRHDEGAEVGSGFQAVDLYRVRGPERDDGVLYLQAGVEMAQIRLSGHETI